MSGILASMIDGLLIGAVYGLAAMGLSLIWGVMDVINLTHGAVIALGMFGMYLLFAAFPVNAYFLLLPIIVAGLVLGLIIYWTAVHWVIDRPPLASLLSTFAVNMIIIGIGTAIWSTSPYNVNFTLAGHHGWRVHLHRQPHRGVGRGGRHRAGVGTVPVSHPAGQGHPGRGGQSRSRRVNGHLFDHGAGAGVCHRHRAGGGFRCAGLDFVPLHHSFRRQLTR